MHFYFPAAYVKSCHLHIYVAQHIQIFILHSALETISLFVYDVILDCSVFVTLSITFYASVNHISVMGPFWVLGILCNTSIKKIINLIMLTVAWKWHENILGETNCILLARYLQISNQCGPGKDIYNLSSGPQSLQHWGLVSWRTIFPWARGLGDGLGMIQVHYIYYALYFYYDDISSTSDHQTLDPRVWKPQL